MLDSSGRLPTGLLSGTITSYGDYDQCMATEGLVDESIPVTGKYCFINIRPPLPPIGDSLNLTGTPYESSWVNDRMGPYARMYARVASGVCIPSVCHESEVTQVLRNGMFYLVFVI